MISDEVGVVSEKIVIPSILLSGELMEVFVQYCCCCCCCCCCRCYG